MTSSETPLEHLSLLRTPLKLIPPLMEFSGCERELLRKYGTWLNALASGKLHPITDAQTQFVAVARGRQTPETEFELVWTKYSKALGLWKESEIRKLTSEPVYSLWSYPELKRLVDSGQYHHSHDQRGA